MLRGWGEGAHGGTETLSFLGSAWGVFRWMFRMGRVFAYVLDYDSAAKRNGNHFFSLGS